MISIPGGSYRDDTHEYRDNSGNWVPGLTSILSLCGFVDYAMIPRDVLAVAAERGLAVHAIASTLAKYGDCDPSYITPELEPYVAAYQRFISESGFVPDPQFVEQPMIVEIGGMRYGLTPDALGTRGKYPTIVELKCSEVAQSYWAVQTAGQELGWFNTRSCGRARRWAVQLLKTGRYKINQHDNHDRDARTFIGALSCVHFRMEAGQKLWQT